MRINEKSRANPYISTGGRAGNPSAGTILQPQVDFFRSGEMLKADRIVT